MITRKVWSKLCLILWQSLIQKCTTESLAVCWILLKTLLLNLQEHHYIQNKTILKAIPHQK